MNEKYGFDSLNGNTVYRVKRIEKEISGTVVVPGSKSMTNRALLLAALSKQDSVLRGVLFSDDSRHFLASLQDLGFPVTIDEEQKCVWIKSTGGQIPNKRGTIDVGSAGTAARFLTAMLALSDGEYIINCSKQMKRRPMLPLFNALISMGAKFEYLEEEGYLPVRVIGNKGLCKDVSMDISESTQFLSALLMVAPATKQGFKITITSSKKDGAYIRITREMLKQFGVSVDFNNGVYSIAGNQEIVVGDYYIEPDVSAACYFYAMAALTGGKVTVKNVFYSSMQGDLKFLEILKQLGCEVKESNEGIQVEGPKDGKFPGITVDMNDFSDQTMTMAVIAAFATSNTHIQNVGHICLQECNRMEAIVNELNRAGVQCSANGDAIEIVPCHHIKPALIRTYDDHRMAMAFTMLGLKADGITIDNPMCCKKTFENYYQVLETLI